MSKRRYFIYSHADTDGGIAAAILARHISDNYPDWEPDTTPVNHGGSKGDWSTREISWPCAVLDFTVHPRLFDTRFHTQAQNQEDVPPCYWIDHHPTGSSYSFLNLETAEHVLENVVTKWDITAVSTPGLMRTHYAHLGMSRSLIERYEECIDVAEIIDGALYATVEAAHDFSTPAVRLQSLFTPSHPCIDRTALYRQLVKQLAKNPSLEDLFDTDPMYTGIIKYEESLQVKRTKLYKKYTTQYGNVACSDFTKCEDFVGLGRFIPYLLYREVEYAIHVYPTAKNTFVISCGINPWNKPTVERHLGNYFAKHFDGGGHAFVAGGRMSDTKGDALKMLIAFLQK